VRALAAVAAVAAAAAGTSFLPSQAITFVHSLAFATFFGTNLWNTFFVGEQPQQQRPGQAQAQGRTAGAAPVARMHQCWPPHGAAPTHRRAPLPPPPPAQA
jgi:hypothetical protein